MKKEKIDLAIATGRTFKEMVKIAGVSAQAMLYHLEKRGIKLRRGPIICPGQPPIP